MKAVSLHGLFLPDVQDVLPKILRLDQKSSTSQGLLGFAITKRLPDKAPWRHQHLALTLSREWVPCLCPRFSSPGLSSGWTHFNNELKTPCLPWVGRLAGSI